MEKRGEKEKFSILFGGGDHFWEKGVGKKYHVFDKFSVHGLKWDIFRLYFNRLMSGSVLTGGHIH